MTVLHSFVASSRSHSIPCRNFDRYTVLCKMCSDTTRAITNSNLVIDARYCLALSSPSPCNRYRNHYRKWCFKCVQCVGSTRPFLIYLFFFALYYFFQHADVHAIACWRIGSYAPVNVDM
jgi:hypothetical protein